MVEAEDDGPIRVEIYDMKGTLILQGVHPCPTKLNIAPLPAGLYLLQATHNDGRREVVNFVKSIE